MTESAKPRVIGFNHIALEVGDIEEALAFYGRLFTFELRGKSDGMAFIDLGDQFVALSEGRTQPPDGDRHVGLVVEDKDALRAALRADGEDVPRDGRLRMRDPSGNQIEIVDYRDVQFTKTPEVLRALGVSGIAKSERARRELVAKGFA
jgi:lactoylglutathione lyase